MKEKVRRHIELARLISKFMCNRLDSDEKIVLQKWLEEDDSNKEKCKTYIEEAISKQDESPYADEKEWNDFERRYKIGEKRHLFKPWMKYAAVVFLILGTAIFYTHVLLTSDKNILEPVAEIVENVPVLALPNGVVVALDHSDSQTLVVDSNRTIRYQHGATVYEDTLQGTEAPVEYNTISVPACCDYSLCLDDGTVIRLNAGTRLKFPSCLSAAKREVWLCGEAFFDVSRHNGKPFVVHTDKGNINVLGTTFNVSAYQDDACTATLLKGRIQFVLGESSEILSPGMQAVVENNSDKIIVQDVDVNTVVAWTKGKFYFKEDTLEKILNTISKWYGVEIVYHNSIQKSLRFTVETERYEKLDDILKMISETGKVRLEKEGNLILVN